MSKTQTNKSRYPSLYSPNQFVTARQYIIELICEKRAKSLKKDLPIKFWRLPEWEQFYKSQLRRCNVLLKKYSETAIIGAIKSIFRVYSLWSKELELEIDRRYKIEQTIVSKQEKVSINRNTLNSVGRVETKRGIIEKLEEIDGPQEEN